MNGYFAFLPWKNPPTNFQILRLHFRDCYRLLSLHFLHDSLDSHVRPLNTRYNSVGPPGNCQHYDKSVRTSRVRDAVISSHHSIISVRQDLVDLSISYAHKLRGASTLHLTWPHRQAPSSHPNIVHQHHVFIFQATIADFKY